MFTDFRSETVPFSPQKRNLTCSKGYKQHFDKCVGKTR